MDRLNFLHLIPHWGRQVVDVRLKWLRSRMKMSGTLHTGGNKPDDQII